MGSKYIGLFKTREDVAREFEEGSGDRYGPGPWTPHKDFPTDAQIIVAAYEHEGYSGDVFVLFRKGGKTV